MNEKEMKRLSQGLQLTDRRLAAEGYTELELRLGRKIVNQLMNAVSLNSEMNKFNSGRILTIVIAFMKTMDQSADQGTAEVLGFHTPPGKN